jgi:hypothetical protein
VAREAGVLDGGVVVGNKPNKKDKNTEVSKKNNERRRNLLVRL